MRIGILTITPNIGFGGNLQAYALKCVLEQMGHQVNIIQYTRYRTLEDKTKFFLKNLCKRIIRKQFVCLSYNSEYAFRRQRLYQFHIDNLNFTREISKPKELQKLINNSFDTVIVGSDQVWRPKYVYGIENYFFANIKHRIKKIAYAVSFGVDNWEFSPSQTEECKRLLRHFKYVSVREKSGINLIRERLDYDGPIYCDLDPTLLADKNIYNKFISDAHRNHKYIFSYILDKNQDKQNFVELIGKETSQPILNFNTNAENSNAPLQERIAPAIEEWLSDLYYSNYVVTDSFHGCVFAIIFNKPFIVYVNKERGAERFKSLLSDYELLDRLCYDTCNIQANIINKPIDWSHVNSKIRAKRAEVYNRLQKTLV